MKEENLFKILIVYSYAGDSSQSNPFTNPYSVFSFTIKTKSEKLFGSRHRTLSFFGLRESTPWRLIGEHILKQNRRIKD